jgi:DNA-binding YbaB/EbfC family protein
MQALNEELKTKRAVGAAGGGLVEVEVNGLAEVVAVRIDPALVDKQDREMIEDLLPAAFNAAHEKAERIRAEALASITGGMQVPGLQDALSQMMGSPPPGDSK